MSVHVSIAFVNDRGCREDLFHRHIESWSSYGLESTIFHQLARPKGLLCIVSISLSSMLYDLEQDRLP
jgi:hypothetical protein